jgi:addiction module HigA family antidote
MLKENLPPVHPGMYIEDALPELGLTQAQFAAVLGCSRQMLSDIIHGRRGLSMEMCFRMSEVMGSTPAFWARIQNEYDIKIASRDRSIFDAVKGVRGRVKAFKSRRKKVLGAKGVRAR